MPQITKSSDVIVSCPVGPVDWLRVHYSGVIMGGMASQITSVTIVYSTVNSGVDQRKHQSSASLDFVWRIHRAPVISPHKWPVTRKMFPFDDVIITKSWGQNSHASFCLLNLCTMASRDCTGKGPGWALVELHSYLLYRVIQGLVC